MKPDLRERKKSPPLDKADRAAREALRDFRKGSQINGGCGEIYAAVAEAIRRAQKQTA